MTREEALNLIRQNVKNENSIKHMLATEAIMTALAKRFNENEPIWGLAGLLHDIDMDITDYKNNPTKHGLVGAEMLEKMGVEKIITDAVRAHNPLTGKSPATLMEKAIFCVDPLTGLIVAATLVLPSKRLADLTAKSVLNRFGEKNFAKGANRETIAACSEIGLKLEEFVTIGLSAMQGIGDQLGL